MAIVAVQFFGLSRGFFRYEERLVGHDAAFRLLADLRVRVYERLEQLAPSGLPAFRRGDLLARMVQDVDSLQDLVIRVIPPFGSAVVVGALTVASCGGCCPLPGSILAVCLLWPATVVPWLTGVLARRREAGSPGSAANWVRPWWTSPRGRPSSSSSARVDAQVGAVRTGRRAHCHRRRPRPAPPASVWPSPPCWPDWPVGAV